MSHHRKLRKSIESHNASQIQVSAGPGSGADLTSVGWLAQQDRHEGKLRPAALGRVLYRLALSPQHPPRNHDATDATSEDTLP